MHIVTYHPLAIGEGGVNKIWFVQCLSSFAVVSKIEFLFFKPILKYFIFLALRKYYTDPILSKKFILAPRSPLEKFWVRLAKNGCRKTKINQNQWGGAFGKIWQKFGGAFGKTIGPYFFELEHNRTDELEHYRDGNSLLGTKGGGGEWLKISGVTIGIISRCSSHLLVFGIARTQSHTKKLCSRVTPFRGNRKGQSNPSAMKWPRLGLPCYLIHGRPKPG